MDNSLETWERSDQVMFLVPFFQAYVKQCCFVINLDIKLGKASIHPVILLQVLILRKYYGIVDQVTCEGRLGLENLNWCELFTTWIFGR
jgi:hypothetical protein